jgi:hypothetical protein
MAPGRRLEAGRVGRRKPDRLAEVIAAVARASTHHPQSAPMSTQFSTRVNAHRQQRRTDSPPKSPCSPRGRPPGRAVRCDRAKVRRISRRRKRQPTEFACDTRYLRILCCPLVDRSGAEIGRAGRSAGPAVGVESGEAAPDFFSVPAHRECQAGRRTESKHVGRGRSDTLPRLGSCLN